MELVMGSIICSRKTEKSAPDPFKKSNHSSLLISATVDAFRGHDFSLLVTAKTCAPAGSSAHAPALQPTNIDGNYD